MSNHHFNSLLIAVIVVFGIQAFMISGLNEKLDNITQDNPQATGSSTYIPPLNKLIKPAPIPIPSLGEQWFDDPIWSPYKEMQRLQNKMDKIFGDSFSRFHHFSPINDLIKEPDVNLQEQEGEYIVTVNVPGADESTLDVKLQDQQLYIAIKTEHSKHVDDDKKGHYQYHERFMGEFQRVLTLAKPVNADKMTSDYHKGVLTIKVPKK